MTQHDAVIAVFGDHRETDAAVGKLIDGAFWGALEPFFQQCISD